MDFDDADMTTCGHCGQRFPMPDLAQVFYHAHEPHRPVEAPTWSGSRRVAPAIDDAKGADRG